MVAVYLIYASMLLLGVILGAWAVVSGVRSPNTTVVTPLPQVASISSAIAQDSDKNKSVAVPRNYVVDAVNRTGPAVVRINASRTVVAENPQIPEAGRSLPGLPPGLDAAPRRRSAAVHLDSDHRAC